MVLALLCVAQVVVVLDVTIVAIALPTIQADLGLSPTVLGWVLTAYPVAFGGFLLAAGRLADRVGRRRMFAIGLAVFGTASLVCGLAPGGALLIAARIAQGLGAAMVTPAALALLTGAHPDGPARARALAWWTAAAAGGGAAGWVLGGLLTGLVGWRWVFLVNVPVCAAVVALTRRILPEHRPDRGRRIDAAGAVLGTAGLAGLVLAVSLAETRGLGDPVLLLIGLAAALLLVGFVVVERRSPDPLLDGRLLRSPGVARANVVAALVTGCSSPPMMLCILHAQQVLGLSPIAAGLLFPPFNAAVIAGSFLGPRVLDRLGGRRAMAAGLLTMAAGGTTLLAISPTAPAWASMPGGMVLLGIGLGVASVASTADGTAGAPPDRQGVASGLVTTSAQVGTALGLAAVIPFAAARTAALGGGPVAQVAGYEWGIAVVAAAAAAGAAAVAGTAVLGTARRASLHDHQPDVRGLPR
jgi:EmrB/QacA subfamily drug resistance transporter